MATKLRITEADVKRWTAPTFDASKRPEFQDTKQPYLYARVSAEKVTWSAFVWSPSEKRMKRDTFGTHKTHTVEKARKVAGDKAADIVGGVDTSKEKRAKREQATRGQVTVADMLDAYIADRAAGKKPLREPTVETYRRELPFLLGDYMHEPMAALDEKIMKRLLAARMKPTMQVNKAGTCEIRRGSEAGALIGAKAINRLCKVNGIPSPLGTLADTWDDFPKAKVRPARLTKAETQALFAWLHDFVQREDAAPSAVRSARVMMIAIVTALRSGTVRAMRWEHVKFDTMRLQLPGEIMKNGKPLTIPLPRVIAELLRPLRKKSGLIFPTVDEDVTKMDAAFVNSMPYKCGPHDGRKVMTVLLLGKEGVKRNVHPYVMKMLTGHAAGNDTTYKSYLDSTDLDDRIEAMEVGTALLDEYYSARIGDKSLVKELDRASETRRVQFNRRASELRRHSRQIKRAAKRARFA